jgi:peroxiredoxin-like protein
MEAEFYEVDLKWKQDRIGEISSPVLPSSIEVATPPQFEKGLEGIWSPEHLFAAAVNSCFMTTFLAIAEKSRLEFENFSCKAKGKLEVVEKQFLMTEIDLFPTLTITSEEAKEKAIKVLEKSEKACLISNSIKSKVNLFPNIQIHNLAVK